MASTSQFEQAICQGQLQPGMNFHERVWAVCARIPAGRVATYADLAQALGSKAYRAVGQAMNRNPFAPRVPCHRVVGSNGQLTGFARGLDAKAQLLQEEGVLLDPQTGRIDLTRCRVDSASLKREAQMA